MHNEIIFNVCNQKFYKDENLTMVTLFKKYGGYFNYLNSCKDTITDIADQFLINLKSEADLSKMIQINEKALYHAFLCGYRPRIFIEELKKFNLF